MERSGYTYIVKSKDNVVKIGYSRNPRERFRTLQTAHADTLTVLAILQGADMEARLQIRFEHLHIRGEWYTYGKDLRQYVEMLDFVPVSVDDFQAHKTYGPLPPERAFVHGRFIRSVG